MAMVATSQPPVPTPKALSRALKALLPSDAPAPAIAANDDNVNAGSIVTISGISVAVVPMPFAIPGETISNALLHEFMWKDARETFEKAKGHVLLSILNPEVDPALQFQNARILSIVTAAVLSTAKGSGVFWQSADRVLEPARFAKGAQDILKNDMASQLWFSLRFFPGSSNPESPLIVCQSTGLAAFLGREIECGPYPVSPADLADKVIVVARYMATSGAVFADGHTLSFGNTKDYDAQIFLDWSSLDGTNKPIFQLRLRSQEEQ